LVGSVSKNQKVEAENQGMERLLTDNEYKVTLSCTQVIDEKTVKVEIDTKSAKTYKEGTNLTLQFV